MALAQGSGAADPWSEALPAVPPAYEEERGGSGLALTGGAAVSNDGRGCRPGPVTQVQVGAGGLTHKFVNDWSYVIPAGGAAIANNGSTTAFDYSMSLIVRGLTSLSREELVAAIQAALPREISCSGSNYKNLLVESGFKPDSLPAPTGWNTITGKVDITWINVEDAVTAAEIKDGVELTLYADPVSTDGHLLRVNTRDTTYVDTGVGNDAGVADTAEAYDVLNLTVTLRDLDPAKHILTPAKPGNVTVNLFDYWVKTKEPTADTNGDILDKSDWHKRPNADSKGNPTEGEAPAQFSTVQDWNKGINEGHLLLFGDGMIHAGLWNKGAGESTQFGNTYAGMEGIVKRTLRGGYPELDLSAARKQLTEGRDYTLVRDYKLAGTQEDTLGTWEAANPYVGTAIQNLSESVIGLWEAATGKSITDADAAESLQYLFDPSVSHANKTCYTNVGGLFQLNDDGYYYYNMRENFAEYDKTSNSFILYDAPATLRSDGKNSVGNFLPFNTASEVFNGLDENDRLTSNVACSGNTMNHHLGMTVDVSFRQPANGMINTGTKGPQPMTFGFSGDDDVWIFLDDVLVLDLGGIHSEIYGVIDFNSGNVYVGRAFGVNGVPANPADPEICVTTANLRDLYKAAGMESATKWHEKTFESGTSHTLKMFYLERGNYDSSLAMRFNLQPLLYQQLKKVDQNGQPVEGVKFALYPAQLLGDHSDDPAAIECLYTDSQRHHPTPFFVKQTATDDGQPLVTLTTRDDGTAQFLEPDGSYFNFADRGEQYYILKEITTPGGYRAQPVDIVLYYDPVTVMLSVANRWTTGAYACSVSHVTANTGLKYGVIENGAIAVGTAKVPAEQQQKGLTVAVPLLQKSSDKSWLALYGSNLTGFDSVAIPGDMKAMLRPILRAALSQAADTQADPWHLDWEPDNRRLAGTLNGLPGLADRYRLNNDDGDMQMIYAIISKEALDDLGVTGDDADARYASLGAKLRESSGALDQALETILKMDNGFRFLSVTQFNRNFRSLVYIPNEQRELRVLKVDQDGQPLAGAQFTLYSDADCTAQVAQGVTDDDGMLVFFPHGANNTPGQAKMVWASGEPGTKYYLRETQAPADYDLNNTTIPVVVGIYSIYADAGRADDGVRVMAGAGTLTQTMRQYAMGNAVNATLQDITATMQVQTSGSFALDGWEDVTLANSTAPRAMNLHFGKNAGYGDYGLHDEDGGKIYDPFFVTDTGFIRARIEQNTGALRGDQYEGADPDVNYDALENIDLTNLFSLLNMVVVTDRADTPAASGSLTVSKTVSGKRPDGSDVTAGDHDRLFAFTLELTDVDGKPLQGDYPYRFYGSDKTGHIQIKDGQIKLESGQEQKLLLHHDESVTILGLPAGTKYKVTETADGWLTTPTTGVCDGEITGGKDAQAAFINGQKPADPDPDKPDPDKPDPDPDKPDPDKPDPDPDNPDPDKPDPDPDKPDPDKPDPDPDKPDPDKPKPDDPKPDDPKPDKPKPDKPKPDKPTPSPEPTDPLEPTPPPVEPSEPVEPTPPPVEPSKPAEPTPPPTEPEKRPTRLPDPNDPDSPETVTLWDEDVPTTYIKFWDEEAEEWVYLPEEDIPLADRTPQTSDPNLSLLWTLVCALSLTGLAVIWGTTLRGKEDGE